MRVKSEVDLGFSILMGFTVIIMVVSIVIIPQKERLIGYSVGFPTLIFLIWIYFGTYYELRENYLYCKSGPFSEKIPYEKVKSLKLSKNMLSSMALSRKRIEIKQHGKGYVMGTTFISPKNREEFMKELAMRCRNLEIL